MSSWRQLPRPGTALLDCRRNRLKVELQQSFRKVGRNHVLTVVPSLVYSSTSLICPLTSLLCPESSLMHPRNTTQPGATMTERLACSLLTKAIRVQSPAGHSEFSDDAVGRRVFSEIFRFRRCSMLTSITLIGSQNLDVKSRPNLFTRGGGEMALHPFIPLQPTSIHEPPLPVAPDNVTNISSPAAAGNISRDIVLTNRPVFRAAAAELQQRRPVVAGAIQVLVRLYTAETAPSNKVRDIIRCCDCTNLPSHSVHVHGLARLDDIYYSHCTLQGTSPQSSSWMDGLRMSHSWSDSNILERSWLQKLGSHSRISCSAWPAAGHARSAVTVPGTRKWPRQQVSGVELARRDVPTFFLPSAPRSQIARSATTMPPPPLLSFLSSITSSVAWSWSIDLFGGMSAESRFEIKYINSLGVFASVSTTRERARRSMLKYHRVIEVSMERRRNEGAGKTGDPRENPPTSGIVRHDSHLRKSGRPILVAWSDFGKPWKTEMRVQFSLNKMVWPQLKVPQVHAALREHFTPIQNTSRQFRTLRVAEMMHLQCVAVLPLSLPRFAASNTEKAPRRQAGPLMFIYVPRPGTGRSANRKYLAALKRHRNFANLFQDKLDFNHLQVRVSPFIGPQFVSLVPGDFMPITNLQEKFDWSGVKPAGHTGTFRIKSHWDFLLAEPPAGQAMIGRMRSDAILVRCTAEVGGNKPLSPLGIRQYRCDQGAVMLKCSSGSGRERLDEKCSTRALCLSKKRKLSHAVFNNQVSEERVRSHKLTLEGQLQSASGAPLPRICSRPQPLPCQGEALVFLSGWPTRWRRLPTRQVQLHSGFPRLLLHSELSTFEIRLMPFPANYM
ncbi:hypothetical protein PR048_023367 [Dryococelus australis]|uniref:Uncharacterized protein n=1 Tax=Dryococelus australis TaxID=614101 RepID=A0ABQ9GTX0_9NEOP|nr:hypothetical protein PR048_023367 [Dryococelus australis]